MSSKRLAAVAACSLLPAAIGAQWRDSTTARDSLEVYSARPITVTERRVPLSHRSISSISLSRDDLRKISDDSEMLIEQAKRFAGVAGTHHIYVDGLPAEHLPAAARIESITINNDAFSAEYSDGDGTRIEIRTNAERAFQISNTRFSRATAPDGLNSRFTSSTRAISAGVAAPLPGLPVVITSDVDMSWKSAHQPIQADVPTVTEADGDPAVSTTQRRQLLGLGIDYRKGDNVRATTSFYEWAAGHSNLNVSGLTLPEAGSDQQTAAREIRTAIINTNARYTFFSGATASWWTDDVNATSNAAGIVVPGAFTSGGSPIAALDSRRKRWTLKNTMAFNGNRPWTIGATLSRRADAQLLTPNPVGNIQFDSPDAYWASVAGGAHTGTAVVARGQSRAHYVSYSAASFGEWEFLKHPGIAAKAGMRADYQTAGSLLMSPRLSVAGLLRGFVLKAGSGLFVEQLQNEPFVKVMHRNGQESQQFLVANTSTTEMASAATVRGIPIVSRVASDVTPARYWIAKLSLQRQLGSFTPGVEYTRTVGAHLLGSRRIRGRDGWTDLLEANRARIKDQLHFHAQYRKQALSLVGQYQWIRARDDADGPFSFPQRQDDLRGEWGPSTAIPPRTLSVIAHVDLGMTSMTLMDTWHAGAPINLTSGLDAEANGLRTDREGRSRNSGRSDSYSSVDLYSKRRMRLPRFVAAATGLHSAHIGFHILNLMGRRNIFALGDVTNSRLFGQPITAGPGRSLRLFAGL